MISNYHFGYNKIISSVKNFSNMGIIYLNFSLHYTNILFSLKGMQLSKQLFLSYCKLSILQKPITVESKTIKLLYIIQAES